MRALLPALVATATLAAAAPALAAWGATGSGSGSATATSLAAPGAPTATGTTTSSISLSWTAATAPGSATVGYWVERAAFGGSTWSDACSSTSAAPLSGTTCTDSGLTAGTDYQYRVTTVLHAWRATSATSAKLSTPAASYTYSLAPTAAGNKTAGTSFDVTITRSDGFSGTASLTFSGAATSPSGQAPVYPAATSYTFVNGTATSPVAAMTLYAAGTNTITVSDGTRTGTGSFTVVAAGAARLAWSGSSSSGGTLSGTCFFTCSYTAVGGSAATFRSRVVLTDTYGNAKAATASTTVTVSRTGGSFTGSAVVTIANGQTVSSTGGNGGTGEITFVTDNGNWSTNSLSMSSSPSFTGASASFAKN